MWLLLEVVVPASGGIGTDYSFAEKVGLGMSDTHRESVAFIVQIFDSN